MKNFFTSKTFTTILHGVSMAGGVVAGIEMPNNNKFKGVIIAAAALANVFLPSPSIPAEGEKK